MLFQQRGELGHEIPLVYVDGTARDLRPLTTHIDPLFLESHSATSLTSLIADLPELTEVDSLRFGSPITRPGAVYCVGMNYAKHAAEGGAEPPKEIVVFLKPPHTIAGPNDDIFISHGFKKVDWEVELAIVVGKRAWKIKAEDDPLQYIFGFSLANDLSDRYWQLEVSGGQWSKGKSGPGFLPLGPSIVPVGDISPGKLRLQSWVNGEIRQDSNTEDMIFNVERIMRDLSQFTVLEPGDIVLTGTPEGVALSGRFSYLTEGDTLRLAIEGLGSQQQRVLRGRQRRERV